MTTTNELEQKPCSGLSDLTAGLGLLARINAHLRQLAPHMMSRDGVALLREAAKEIERTLPPKYGVNHCSKHDGVGFISDCVICNPGDA